MRRQEVMMAPVQFGDVLCSAASEAIFLVIAAGAAGNMPTVNGAPMFRGSRQPCSATAEPRLPRDLRGGQRYIDDPSGLTLLCIRPGHGTLHVDGRAMTTESRLVAVAV